MRRAVTITVLAVLFAARAAAGELVLGAGVDDIREQEPGARTAGVGIEYRTAPLATQENFGLALGLAAETDLDVDIWVGAGPVGIMNFGVWRAGISAMPGYYKRGDGNRLGSELEFRLQLFADRAVSERMRLGFALEHKSNANTGDFNPGVESVFITFGWNF